MVDIEVQVGAWLMHLFMVQVDYRLFGQVIVTGYLYRFGAWLMRFSMVQVEVQFDVWYMLAQVIGIGCYKLIGTGLKQYISQ
jgi:Na+(H+)/acetate symporter ActP